MIGAYLRSLSSRERMLLALGLIALAATIIYVAVLEPRYQRLRMLRAQVPAQQADLAWMQEQVRRYGPLLARQESAEGLQRLPLLTIVEQTSTRAGLRANITRMQPADQGSVRVWFDDVPFDPWLLWLDSLGRQKISVSAVNIDRADEGKVNVRLTLGS